MEDKKIRIVNIIFLIFTIIYLLSTLLFKEYSEGLIIGLGTRLYLVGFIVFVICNIHNKKRNVGIRTFSILAIVTVVATVIEYIRIISYEYVGEYITMVYDFEFIDIALIIMGIIQKVLLVVLLIFNMKGKAKIGMAYTLLVVTAILNIIMLFQHVTINYCLLIVTHIYIAVYLLYFNKGISIKSFRNIILLIITVFFIIVLFILSVTWLPKFKYNNVVEKIKKIELATSNIPSITRYIQVNNNIQTISYNVSNNVQEVLNNGTMSMYLYNDLRTMITTQELNNEQIYLMKKEAENFKINGRDFYIIPASTHKGMMIYTKIRNNIHCGISIDFSKNVSLSKKDLQNLKPFFYIYEK